MTMDTSGNFFIRNTGHNQSNLFESPFGPHHGIYCQMISHVIQKLIIDLQNDYEDDYVIALLLHLQIEILA